MNKGEHPQRGGRYEPETGGQAVHPVGNVEGVCDAHDSKHGERDKQETREGEDSEVYKVGVCGDRVQEGDDALERQPLFCAKTVHILREPQDKHEGGKKYEGPLLNMIAAADEDAEYKPGEDKYPASSQGGNAVYLPLIWVIYDLEASAHKR